jgi:DNA-binding transcriptional MerR regulator
MAAMRTVHEIAERVGLPARRIRYYDRIGLAGASRRTESGYRLYDAEDEARLRFVKHARSLGLSLDETRELLAAAEAGCCEGVLPELDRILEDKVAELDRRIAEMQEFRDRLSAFRAGTGSGCGCRGHGPFCACLDGAPDLTPEHLRGSRRR